MANSPSNLVEIPWTEELKVAGVATVYGVVCKEPDMTYVY